MAAVRKSQIQDPQLIPGSVELREWNRHGWTYHAKGVLVAFLPSVLDLNRPSGPSIRDLAFTKSRISTHPHALWFYEPQLALCSPGHRTDLCDAREFCDCSEEASARATRPEQFRRRLERRPEKRTTCYKTSSLASERIPLRRQRYPDSFQPVCSTQNEVPSIAPAHHSMLSTYRTTLIYHFSLSVSTYS